MCDVHTRVLRAAKHEAESRSTLSRHARERGPSSVIHFSRSRSVRERGSWLAIDWVYWVNISTTQCLIAGKSELACRSSKNSADFPAIKEEARLDSRTIAFVLMQFRTDRDMPFSRKTANQHSRYNSRATTRSAAETVPNDAIPPLIVVNGSS
ncbi:hypothetical protein DBV15_08971 [Temnothorax longispinosus]|uniref:Uncharacterized protein n=1 Tax=Temnothorax longispinosus TaxID=300112 RepID=A0A4S2KTG2_9HYME|nr:hypothetical protein DBV15_08971 [Temnothorax longispinosus]